MPNNNRGRTESLERTEEGRERAFRFTGLVPRQDPAKAAALAIHNLSKLVSELPTDALIGFAVTAHGISGWVNDSAPTDYLTDLRYALNPIARITSARHRADLSRPLLEVVPVHHPGSRAAVGTEGEHRPQSLTVPEMNAVPSAALDPMWDFLKVLDTVPGGMMSILMSPASELEQEMSDAVWRATFTERTGAAWQLYRGTPVRLRVVLHADAPEIPARLRAELKVLTQQLAFRELSPADERELAQPQVLAVKGHVVPEGVFRSLVRLPGATEGVAVPGLRTIRPPKVQLPYDRPAKPPVALRLGRCTTPNGHARSVWVSPDDLCRHVRIVGSTGSGKSTALRGLLGQLIEQGYGVMLLDPHGTLATDLAGDVRDPDRILYVDYSDPESPPPFNPLRGSTQAEFDARLQGFVNIIVDRDSEEYTGPKWRRTFGLVARACWKLLDERASLVAAFSVVGSQSLTRELADALQRVDPALHAQLHQELGDIRGETNSDLWSWLVCKGEEILGSEGLTRVLGTGSHAVDLDEAIDQSRAVLINLGLGRLGERSAQLLGCMWISELRLAMLNRKPGDRPFVLAIDEAHLFQYGALPSLLDQARKFGIGVIVCHQRPDQLRHQLKDALAANAGSYLQLRTGGPQDAAIASAMLSDWPIADLTRMPDLTGAAVVSRNGVPSEPFSIAFDFFVRHAAQLSDLELRGWRTEAVRQIAFDQLVSPYLALEPTTRAGISKQLATARATHRDRALARLQRPDSDDLDQTTSPAAAPLPSWLEL